MAWFFQKDVNKLKKDLDKSKLPVHIAFIMDGNGRWAKKRLLPRNLGHREGANTLRRVIRTCGNLGVKYLTFYAFSTENWNRPKEEVDALMALLMDLLKNYEQELEGEEIRIRVIGDKSRLPEPVRRQAEAVEWATRNNKAYEVNMAINYGSRDEIIHGVKKVSEMVASGQIAVSDIDDKLFSRCLYTTGTPDPDLIIRTSGESRLSNYLLWQSAYSELYFTDILWPDFNEQELMKALLSYQSRDRRFGKVKES